MQHIIWWAGTGIHPEELSVIPANLRTAQGIRSYVRGDDLPICLVGMRRSSRLANNREARRDQEPVAPVSNQPPHALFLLD